MPINKTSILDWPSILAPIIQEYWGKKIELDYETPFQLLIAVILSAQTTDKQVNKITPPFFKKVKEAKNVINIDIEEIMNDLKYVNFLLLLQINIMVLFLMISYWYRLFLVYESRPQKWYSQFSMIAHMSELIHIFIELWIALESWIQKLLNKLIKK